MSNQVYQNQLAKYYNFPGLNYYNLIADGTIDGQATLAMLWEPADINVASAIDIVGSAVVFKRPGHYTFSLYLELLELDSQGAYHPEIIATLASASSNSGIVARTKTDVNDLVAAAPYIIVPLSGSVFVESGDSLTIDVKNWDTVGKRFQVRSAGSALILSSAY